RRGIPAGDEVLDFFRQHLGHLSTGRAIWQTHYCFHCLTMVGAGCRIAPREEQGMPEVPILIVGAGAAGLSAAGALQQMGHEAVLLDADSAIGGTWARRYDRLHLHTIRSLSGLAGYPIPRRYPRYLSK